VKIEPQSYRPQDGDIIYFPGAMSRTKRSGAKQIDSVSLMEHHPPNTGGKWWTITLDHKHWKHENIYFKEPDAISFKKKLNELSVSNMIKYDTGFETNDVKHTGWTIEKEQYVIRRVYMGISDEDSQRGKQEIKFEIKPEQHFIQIFFTERGINTFRSNVNNSIQNDKEKIVSDILMSPFQIDILSNLSGQVQGLPFVQLVEKERQIHKPEVLATTDVENVLKKKLRELQDKELVTLVDNIYLLTADGKEIYKIIQDVAQGAKEKALL
jgi:hypothetical protein